MSSSLNVTSSSISISISITAITAHTTINFHGYPFPISIPLNNSIIPVSKSPLDFKMKHRPCISIFTYLSAVSVVFLLVLCDVKNVSGFTIHSNPSPSISITANLPHQSQSQSQSRSSTSTTLQMNRGRKGGGFDYDDDDDDDDKFEYARVRRRGGGGRDRYADEDDDEYEEYDPNAKSSNKWRRVDDYDDEFDDDEYDDEYDSDDEYDDDDDEFDDIIPNALLDNIDPDGAVDRLPELFADGKFWKDSALWLTLAFVWVLGRYDNPMLNGVVDLDKVDFTQFYDKAPM